MRKMSIGFRLGSARRTIGISIEDFSELTDIPVSTLKKYESDNRIPGGEAIQSVAKTGINLHWLLTGEGPMLIKDLQQETLGVLDTELLQLIIEAIETALEQTGRKMQSEKKAKLVLATYDIYSDSNTKPDSAKILNFIKSAG